MSLLEVSAGTMKLAKVNPEDIFGKAFPALFEKSADFVKQIGASYQFNILGEGGGFWVVDLKVPEVREGREPNADCVIEMDTETFDDFMSGKLEAKEAMEEGELRINGNPEYIIALGHLMGGI